MSSTTYTVTAEQAGATLAALLRAWLPGQSWSAVRRLVETRRARVGTDICLDPARRLKEGETVEILARPGPKPHQPDDVTIRHLDNHLIVVEKPSGIPTVRHPLERAWNEQRKALNPTLDELVPKLLAREEGRVRKG